MRLGQNLHACLLAVHYLMRETDHYLYPTDRTTERSPARERLICVVDIGSGILVRLPLRTLTARRVYTHMPRPIKPQCSPVRSLARPPTLSFWVPLHLIRPGPATSLPPLLPHAAALTIGTSVRLLKLNLKSSIGKIVANTLIPSLSLVT